MEDGKEYQRGENLGDSIKTRCGTSIDFPCFCNPDLEKQAECPYCTFATGGGGLYCAKNEESISFQDGSVVRVCSCEVPSDFPEGDVVRDCIIDNDAPVGFCEFPNFEGELIEFEDGESFGDLIPGVCEPTEDWPTYCKVVEDYFITEYPYCVYNDAPETVCAKHNETVTYTNNDGELVSCSCTFNFELSVEGPSNCKVLDEGPDGPSEPTKPPSVDKPVEPPTPDNGNAEATTAPTLTPVTPQGSDSNTRSSRMGFLVSTIATMVLCSRIL